jgi:hypothetical protein
LSWRLDAALRTSDGALMLQFESETAREGHEVALAIRMARVVGSDSVVVLGMREKDGRREIVGSLLSLDSGRVSRLATLSLDPVRPGPGGVKALARYLALGEPNDAIEVAAVVPPAAEPARGGRSPVWKWLALGAGTAAVAGGAILIRIDGPILDEAGDHTTEEYDTAPAGYAVAGVGLALIATGVVLWLREDSSPEPGSTVTVVPAADGAVLGIAGVF